VAGLLGADVGLSLTGVAGPAIQEGQPVGTVFVGVSGLPLRSGAHQTAEPGSPRDEALDARRRAIRLSLRGDRELVRERACTSALDLLRRMLLRAAE
jgi:nicotinamide-nucleotide amidase